MENNIDSVIDIDENFSNLNNKNTQNIKTIGSDLDIFIRNK
jgi:hypothetical protein